MGIVPFHGRNLNSPLSQQHVVKFTGSNVSQYKLRLLSKACCFSLKIQFSSCLSASRVSNETYFKRTWSGDVKTRDGNYYNYSVIISIDCLLSGWSPIWNKDIFVTLTQSLLFVIYRDLFSIVLPISCVYWTCNFVRHFLHNKLSVSQSSPPFYESLYSSGNM